MRALVVDDSRSMRSIILKQLKELGFEVYEAGNWQGAMYRLHDAEIQVVGVAENGREALEKIPVVHPDLLILDYEMPEMDGLETLIEVRRNYPSIRVIIFSSHTRHGAKVTLDALWHGADDYVAK